MSREFEEFDDFVNEEDLLKPKKKKINGKKKGNRVELELTKVLAKRFGEGFSRSIGSGNRWSQAVLPKHARDVFSGDLIVPKGFKFVLESKGGYDNIDMTSVFVHGNSELDSFLDQAINDGKRCNRKPMLCWKKTRRPWLSAILTEDLEGRTFKYQMNYGRWTIVALDNLLQLEDEFFLETNSDVE